MPQLEEDQAAMQDWNALAPKYDPILRTRFQPLYTRMTELLDQGLDRHHEEEKIEENEKGEERKRNKGAVVLDFGAGTGEPSLTILNAALDGLVSRPIHLVTADWSEEMLARAKERHTALVLALDRKGEAKHASPLSSSSTPSAAQASSSMVVLRIDPDGPLLDQLENGAARGAGTEREEEEGRRGNYDAIVTSLCLPYVRELKETLSIFHTLLRGQGGVLLSSHWPHPSKVPFLRVLKQARGWFAGEEPLTVKEMEETPFSSFSLWKLEPYLSLLQETGFEVLKVETLSLPMRFDKVQDFLAFYDGQASNNKKTVEAREEIFIEKLVKNIGGEKEKVRKEGFSLPSDVVIVMARALSSSDDR